VEAAKLFLHQKTSLGDAFVFPIVLGTAIGRIGCFLTGLSDDTYGTPTSLPWGVDFGDGIRRHPTQVYEIVFVLSFGTMLFFLRRRLRTQGELFRAYIAGYCAFRFLVEFIKPGEVLVWDLSAIQIASLTGILLSCASWLRIRNDTKPTAKPDHV
jgi:prolipoprotein diacylglyceryltransferase